MKQTRKHDPAKNPDPLTGAPGSHPIGTGLGAAAGGLATGAVVGSVAGPIGTAVGAAAGAIVGGVTGKAIAEAVDPTEEAAYWREHHQGQHFNLGRPYTDFEAAYRTGYRGFAELGGSGVRFEDREAELRRRFEDEYPDMSWENARPASRAAWQRIQDRTAGERSVRGDRALPPSTP